MKLIDNQVGVMVLVSNDVATVHIASDTGDGRKVYVPHFTLSYDNLADGKVAAVLVEDERLYYRAMARAVSLAAVQRERDRMQALIKDAYL